MDKVSFFRNMKIGPKLLMGFVVVALITGVVALVSYSSMENMKKAEEEIVKVRLPSITALLEIQDAQARILVGERGLINRRLMAPDIRKAQYDYIETAYKDAEDAWKRYEPLPQTKEEEAAWRKFVPAWTEWKRLNEQVVSLSREKDRLISTGAALSDPRIDEIDIRVMDQSLAAREAYLRARALVQELVNINEKVIFDKVAAADATNRSATKLLTTAAFASVLLAVLLGFYLSRSISKPITYLTVLADRIAAGDVSVEAKTQSGDETGILTHSFAKMIESTREQAGIVEQVASGNLDVQVKPRSDADVLSQSIGKMVSTLRALVKEAESLTAAAVEGRLSTRGAADKFSGGYREIVQGINKTLDAVITPVNEAAAVLSRLAQNDLTSRVTGDFQGDHAKIKNSLNTAIESLSEIISQVIEASDQVGTAANQISVSAQGVASGTAEQASSLEEVSSSLEEISGMTKNNAANANQALGLSKVASQSAEDGKQAMERMNKAIAEIKSSSDETARIIKTIDEIAFQTNLLALNAAVEAARAGEAGRGFAVVAEEVRNLALRSAEAAKDTAKMIEEAVKRADNGVKIAEEVNKALLEIADGSKKVNDLVAEIAAASQEQSKGIEQVSIATSQMDKVTQQNASSAEESASAAEELSSQATQLADMVKRFTISGQSTRPSRAAAAMRRPQSQPARTSHDRDRRLAPAVGQTVPRPSADTRKPGRLIPLDDDGDFSDF